MEKKYLIYRVLVITNDGKRLSHGVEVWTDNLDEARKECRRDLGECLPVKRIYFHYHEKKELLWHKKIMKKRKK